MDLHTELLLGEYTEKLDDYSLLKVKVLEILEGFVNQLGVYVNSISGRVKTEDSLKGKLHLKGYKYQTVLDITDIVGVRIVTFYSDEIDKFAALIEKTFDIDWENSVDRRKLQGTDTFGYSSLHFICRLPKSVYFDEKHPEINNIPFEVQIRTVLQHAWATITHDTGYKNDIEVPKIYLRRLNRLAGLLELADEQFLGVRNDIASYRKKVKDIVKSGKLEEVGFDGDSFKAYTKNGAFDDLNNRIASIGNMEIEEVSLRPLLSIFKYINFETLKEFDDWVKKYSDSAYRLMVYQFQGKDIDIITSSAGPIALCEVYALENSDLDGMLRLLDEIFGPRKSNQQLATRLFDIGRKMGLVKGSK